MLSFRGLKVLDFQHFRGSGSPHGGREENVEILGNLRTCGSEDWGLLNLSLVLACCPFCGISQSL